jgi:hypothetical protein
MSYSQDPGTTNLLSDATITTPMIKRDGGQKSCIWARESRCGKPILRMWVQKGFWECQDAEAFQVNIPVLTNPFNHNGVIPLSPSQFHYVFTNELGEKESEKVWNESQIPGSAHVLWQGAMAGLHNSGDGEEILGQS